MNVLIRFCTGFFLAAVLFVLSACSDSSQPAQTDHVSVYSGAEQCTAPGKPFSNDLIVYAYDDRNQPISGEKLIFEPANGSDLKVEPKETVTSFGGMASVKVFAGRKTGDQYLNVRAVSNPGKVSSIRFVSGVEILGTPLDREGAAGKKLKEPVGIRIWKAPGQPASGCSVYFKSPLKLDTPETITNEQGEASTSVTLGQKTAQYDVDIEIPEAGMNNRLRSITVKALSLDLWKLIINVFGGLALFVLGMKMMSDGLQKAAGEKMRSILHLFSSNCYVAIIAGALVTAVVQSSSASTVMVIGFVNAGLLNLVQSIGIIFGANIGTTITAQIISFNISAVAMPAIILGLIIGFIHWQRLRGWGESILGFGLIFFGLTVMSTELKVISAFPSFVNFFKMFECAPVDGLMPIGALIGAIMVGLIATVVVQSSAAVIGIVFALATSGLLDVYTGTLIVLGSNIGTTITAQFAAIPANRIAKQAALAHTLFNLIGVLVIVATFWIPWGHSGIPVFFYIVNQITAGNGFAPIPQNVPRHIANAHTLFNIVTTLVLTPFIPFLARLCERVIPLTDKKVKYQYLEPHLLNSPAVALEQSVFALRKMLKKSWRMINKAVLEHFLPCSMDEEKIQALEKRESRIDRFQLEITDYLVKITRRSLSKNQADIIPLLMHCTNDAERIADHTEIIIGLTKRLQESSENLSDTGKQEVEALFDLLSQQAQDTISALSAFTPALAKNAIGLEKTILKKADEYESNHIKRLAEGKCTAIVGVIFIELLAEFCKISRHLKNIAERAANINVNYMKINAEHRRTRGMKPSENIQNPTPLIPEPAEEGQDD